MYKGIKNFICRLVFSNIILLSRKTHQINFYSFDKIKFILETEPETPLMNLNIFMNKSLFDKWNKDCAS